MNWLLDGLGTGTYCIHAAAVFQGSDTDGLLFSADAEDQVALSSMKRSA